MQQEKACSEAKKELQKSEALFEISSDLTPKIARFHMGKYLFKSTIKILEQRLQTEFKNLRDFKNLMRVTLQCLEKWCEVLTTGLKCNVEENGGRFFNLMNSYAAL